MIRKMPTKKQYSDLFNRLLGTSVDWTGLKLEELVQLATLFDHPEVFLGKLGVNLDKESKKRLLDLGLEALEEFTERWEGPFARLYRRYKALEEEKGKK